MVQFSKDDNFITKTACTNSSRSFSAPIFQATSYTPPQTVCDTVQDDSDEVIISTPLVHTSESPNIFLQSDPAIKNSYDIASGLTPFCSTFSDETNSKNLCLTTTPVKSITTTSTPSTNTPVVITLPEPEPDYKSYNYEKEAAIQNGIIEKVQQLRYQKPISEAYPTSDIDHILRNLHDLRPVSTYLTCDNCHRRIYTEVEYRAGVMTVVKCALIAIFG